MNTAKNILVVLGYPANDDGTPGPILKARLDKAIELYKNGTASKIIVTGGAVSNHHVESEVMEQYCIQHGVSATDIMQENQSRNTYENARMVREMIEEKGYEKAIVVTSSFHKMRAKTFFARVVGNVSIVSAPFPAGFSLIKRAIFLAKEYIIIVLYNLGLLNGRYSIQQ